MEYSNLLYMIETHILRHTYNEYFNEESDYKNSEEIRKAKLEEKLGEEEKKLLMLYVNALSDRIYYAYEGAANRLLFLGIKYGMEIQQAFEEEKP